VLLVILAHLCLCNESTEILSVTDILVKSFLQHFKSIQPNSSSTNIWSEGYLG
jgi:hypothetical protein